MKRKVNPVSEESISTCSALNSDLAKCPTAPFNSLTSITLSKKDHTTGVQESRTQKYVVYLFSKCKLFTEFDLISFCNFVTVT